MNIVKRVIKDCGKEGAEKECRPFIETLLHMYDSEEKVI